MPRYIDADKLIELATHEGAYGYVDVHDICNVPTADVVERKKAEWEICGTFDDMLRCSNCRFKMPMISEKFNFCPDCGADMREVKPDE